jgi:CHAD domain-containing protein
MLKHEAGVIDGRGFNDLHDMRVAVRRLRAAVRLFRPYLPKSDATFLRKELRRLGRALGPTRDLDVMLANVAAYRAELPPHGQDALTPLLQRWQKMRARSQRDMVKYLTGKRYQLLMQFLDRFAVSEATRAAGTGAQSGSRASTQAQTTPVLATEVQPLIAKRYKKLMAYGPSLDGVSAETLHALRIDCKRLRYALEFLREVLAPEARTAIRNIKLAQDHLGELNDADVAGKASRILLEKWQRAGNEERYPAAARAALREYLAYCDAQVQANAQSFPVIWASLTGSEFRQRMHALESA